MTIIERNRKLWAEAITGERDKEVNVAELWEENSTPSVFTVPLGYQGSDEDVQSIDVVIDQNSSAHGAIYGRVGMGKSVALDTFFLTLAAKYPPNVAEFVFASGKGRVSQASKLPHTKKAFTVYDAEQVKNFANYVRDLISEREKFAKENELLTITPTDLPAVFIAVEEVWGVLDSGLGDVLDDVATVGRALGIHLVVVGQLMKPGRYSEQFIQNLGWGMSFDPSQNDVVEWPSGMVFDATKPGRGFFSSRNETTPLQVFYLREYGSDDVSFISGL